MMASSNDIGKINEGVVLSNFTEYADPGRSGHLSSSRRVSPSHTDQAQGSCSEKHNTNWYCRFIVSHTTLAFVIVFGAHVVLLALTAVLTVSGYDVMKFAFGRLPLQLPEDSTKLRTDAWLYAKNDADKTTKSSVQLPRSAKYQTVALVYGSSDGNIFTKKNLRAIQECEEEIFRIRGYQDKLCQLQGKSTNMTCKLPLSIVRFFDGSYRNIHEDFYDPNFENIPKVLYTAQSKNFTKAILNFHLAKDAVIEMNTSTSQYTRSFLYTGWPLPGFSNTYDDDEEQAEKLNDLTVDIFSSILERKHKDGVGGMDFYYNNRALRTNAIQQQIIYDMMLAVASLVFIFLFLWFQTGSLWLTAWGVFSIVSSFNITNLIYRIIFDFRYFGMFHVLSIFIILGIGCDDIFIFMDTWKQSNDLRFTSLAHRLSKVYKSAAKTTFITSFTTMAAFLSNMQSPLLAIYSFGLFSAILIVVNYFSIIIFFPVVIVLHHKARKGKCCCVRIQRTAENQNAKKISHYVNEFFEGWFFTNVVTHKFIRWVVVVFFTTLAVLSVVFATKLEANKEQIKLWRSDTNWNKVRDIEANAFRASQEDRVIIVHIVWGLKEQDRSGCHHTDFECKGKTVLDLEFDLNPPECQLAMLDLCREMKNLPAGEERKLHLRRSQATGEVEIECIFQRMNEFFAEVNLSFPLNEEKINRTVLSNPNIYKSPPSKNITTFFEVGSGFFLTQGGKKDYASSFDYKKYNELIQGVIYPHEYRNISEGTKYDNRLLYVAIALNTTVNPSTLAYEKGLEIYDDWEKFVNQKMRKLPQSCNKGFQTTIKPFNIWQWLKVQKLLVINAITGILIGLVLSVVVLTITTTNVIIGVMATLTIGMVTCGVLAMISVVGWSLGILESLNLTLIVGLAVDYVVHLAEGYMVLENEDRKTRVKYTLGHVGISVFSGACTTLGSSIFMLAAQIVFFSQFGIFIFCTIGLSILYSLFFFTTVLALIGPEGETGSIRPIMRCIKRCICRKEQDGVNANVSKENGGRDNSLVFGNNVVVTKI